MKWVIAFFLSSAMAFFAGELRAENHALVLHQTSSYLGEQVAYILPNLIVIKSELGTVIMRPAENTIVIYSDKKKLYLQEPYSQWVKRFKGRLANDHCCRLKQVKTGTICGRQCLRYIREGRPGHMTDLWEFWMAPQSGLPGATLEALGRFADFPQVGGLPLRAIKRPVRYEINCKSVYGDPISGLETTRIERKPLPPGLYKLPTGYRKVDDEVELLLADEGESMEGLLDEAPPQKAAAKAVQKSAR